MYLWVLYSASASSQNNKTQYATTLSKKYFVGLSIQQLAACMVQLDSTQASSVFRSLTGFKNHYRVPTLVPCDGPYNENRASLTEKLILARCLGFRLMVTLREWPNNSSRLLKPCPRRLWICLFVFKLNVKVNLMITLYMVKTICVLSLLLEWPSHRSLMPNKIPDRTFSPWYLHSC